MIFHNSGNATAIRLAKQGRGNQKKKCRDTAIHRRNPTQPSADNLRRWYASDPAKSSRFNIKLSISHAETQSGAMDPRDLPDLSLFCWILLKPILNWRRQLRMSQCYAQRNKAIPRASHGSQIPVGQRACLPEGHSNSLVIDAFRLSYEISCDILAENLTMNIGFQTIIWGHRFEDIVRAFSILQHFRFKGVEIFQSPDNLPPAKELLHLLREHDLKLAGLSGGTVEDRIRYADGVLHPNYLYTQVYDEREAALAKSVPIPLALHPHAFTPVRRLKMALNELALHPDLMLLPDTAHLAVVGDDPLDAVRRAWGRLAAIHLKDWTPVYGRSVHRYAK
ncbi:MAG TPA: sugar phosphate isomerase/epimerase, partial [Bryobacteraceae bacterium]